MPFISLYICCTIVECRTGCTFNSLSELLWIVHGVNKLPPALSCDLTTFLVAQLSKFSFTVQVECKVICVIRFSKLSQLSVLGLFKTITFLVPPFRLDQLTLTSILVCLQLFQARTCLFKYMYKVIKFVNNIVLCNILRKHIVHI